MPGEPDRLHIEADALADLGVDDGEADRNASTFVQDIIHVEVAGILVVLGVPPEAELAVQELVHGHDRAARVVPDVGARELLFEGLRDVLEPPLVGVDVEVGILGLRGDEGGARERDFLCGARCHRPKGVEGVVECHASRLARLQRVSAGAVSGFAQA